MDSPTRATAPPKPVSTQLVGAALPGIRCVPGRAGQGLASLCREEEFEAYLKCEASEHGFCAYAASPATSERLVAFSCKKRGFCPSCGARRMAETAALLADGVLPALPCAGGWSASPSALRFLALCLARHSPRHWR
ncbi:MAG: transposase zinc-binding domain-containing protein [Gammaproteobacteria bacterium]|nr:transposase zinc-binding domain-containing protein [Gammaproteobacteria bacterium]